MFLSVFPPVPPSGCPFFLFLFFPLLSLTLAVLFRHSNTPWSAIQVGCSADSSHSPVFTCCRSDQRTQYTWILDPCLTPDQEEKLIYYGGFRKTPYRKYFVVPDRSYFNEHVYQFCNSARICFSCRSG